jgi:hypothetical protein
MRIKRVNESSYEDDMVSYKIRRSVVGGDIQQEIISQDVLGDFFSSMEEFGDIKILFGRYNIDSGVFDIYQQSEIENENGLYQYSNLYEIAYVVKITFLKETNDYVWLGIESRHNLEVCTSDDGIDKQIKLLSLIKTLKNRLGLYDHSFYFRTSNNEITCLVRNNDNKK